MNNEVTYFEMNEIEKISKAIRKVLPEGSTCEDVVFVCVGTDRSTGDSLGPYIGTQLTKLGYQNVYGTLKHPVHGQNIEEKIKSLPENKFIIAIDACLNQSVTRVGSVFVQDVPLKPGAGVKKELPQVGDCCICGVVNVSGFMEYFVLQNTRLSFVMEMGDYIVSSIVETLPLISLVNNKEVAASGVEEIISDDKNETECVKILSFEKGKKKSKQKSK